MQLRRIVANERSEAILLQKLTHSCPCFSPGEQPPDSRKFASSSQTDDEIQEREAGPRS